MDSSSKLSPTEVGQHHRISNYYKFQSQIYDATRWAFLFGRIGILKHIPFTATDKFCIAEIGCGTGINLKYIAKNYPDAKSIGVDVSSDMLNRAKEKLKGFENDKTFHNLPYGQNATFLRPAPDIILFSYALTMINPQWEELIQKAYVDLPKGGKIMVVDFYDSKFPLFKNHMSNHHVRMDAHLLPVLKKIFKTNFEKINNAYGGIWQYFMFVGEKV